jgi:hypothetical protein
MITQLVAEALRPSGNAQTSSKAESSIQLKLHTLLPVQPQRLPGYRGDIPAVDVVQVNETLGDALGKWAFGNDGGCRPPSAFRSVLTCLPTQSESHTVLELCLESQMTSLCT